MLNALIIHVQVCIIKANFLPWHSKLTTVSSTLVISSITSLLLPTSFSFFVVLFIEQQKDTSVSLLTNYMHNFRFQYSSSTFPFLYLGSAFKNLNQYLSIAYRMISVKIPEMKMASISAFWVIKRWKSWVMVFHVSNEELWINSNRLDYNGIAN